MTSGDSEFAGLRGRLARVTLALSRWRRRWYATPVLAAGLFAGLLALPYALDVSVFGASLGGLLGLNVLVVALIWAAAAQSWNIVSGFAGQFSFGHAAFFGLGAYVPIVLLKEFAVSPWLGMVLGGLVASAYACCIGLLSFRFDIRGSYFALATLAFAELLLYVFINTESLGGASGFVKPLPRAYGAEFGLAAFQFRDTLPYYYVILALLGLVTAVAWGIKRSRLGHALFAIRDDEDAARSLGIPTRRYKLLALVCSAFFTAWIGTFWSMYFTSIRPSVVFGLMVNLDVLLPAVIGGLGTILGPIVGSLLVTVVSESARGVVAVPQLQDVVYGLLLLAIVLKSPGGIVSWPGLVADRLLPERRQPSSPDGHARVAGDGRGAVEGDTGEATDSEPDGEPD